MENALYCSEEVMPAIDRKKSIRVRDRATMTNLLLGLDGFTVASGVHSRSYNPAMISIPLKLDDTICVGMIHRKGIPLSSWPDEDRAFPYPRPARRSPWPSANG